MKQEIERRFLTFYNDLGDLIGRYEVTKMDGQFWKTYKDKGGTHYLKFLGIDGAEHLQKLGNVRWTFGVKKEALH